MSTRIGLATGRQPFHYMYVVSGGPMIMLRTPWPMPRWRAILKAVTPVMRAHGHKAKDVMAIEGFLPWPSAPFDEEQADIEKRLAQAYGGDTTRFKAFRLYDWQGGRFVLARPATIP